MSVLDKTSDAALFLKLRVIIYSVLVIFSFIIFTSIGIMMERFGGPCPLYADYRRAWIVYSHSRCNFPMVVAILFQLLYLLFRLVVLILFFLGKLPAEIILVSDKMEIVYALIDAFAFFLTFIGACVLSAGMNSMCSHFNRCEMFSWVSPAIAAQAGAWLSTFLWLFIAVWGLLFIWRTGKIPFLKRKESPKKDEEQSGT